MWAAGDLCWKKEKKKKDVALAWASKVISFAAESNPNLPRIAGYFISRCSLSAMCITFDLM